MKTLILGSRGSRLALWQAEHVRSLITALPGAPPVSIEIISTRGDRIQDVPLSAVSGQAFFTREIETALAEGRIDLAVHSMKDLETTMPDGLRVAAVPRREDPRDAFLSPTGSTLAQLQPGARVGTSSLRRRAQLARAFPHLRLEELRGNVPTRIRKMQEGEYEGIILATAGITRLGMGDLITESLDPERFIPAPAQGALALQIRSEDVETARWVEALDDPASRRAVEAERALLARAEGGCQLPLGAYARMLPEGEMKLSAIILSPDGKSAVSDEIRGPIENPRELGIRLAERMLDHGADEILREMRNISTEEQSPSNQGG